MKNHHNTNDNTRERILAAAEKLFAEKGFNGVSVRQITKAADCNLAAVNYYFGNKKQLYFDVFRHQVVPRVADIRKQFEEGLSKQDDITLETIVRAFTTAFMRKHMADDEHEGQFSLIHREIHNPTGAIEIFIKEAIAPFFDVIISYFKKFQPEEKNTTKLKLNIFSVLALSLYFSHARLPVSKITGKDYDEAFMNQLIEHTISFAMHGLSGNK